MGSIATNRDVMVQDNLAFVANWEHGLKIIDVSNPTTALLVGSLNISLDIGDDEYGPQYNYYAENVVVQNHLAFVSIIAIDTYMYSYTDWGFISIIDVSNPSSPLLVDLLDTYELPNPVQGLTVQNNLAFVTYAFEEDNYGLAIIDISDFTDPGLTLTGTAVADILDGTTKSDRLSGGLGNDTLNGFEAGDALNGDEGNDSLNGGAGNDLLFGGDDQDSLNGGVDNDSVNGDAGNDLLIGGDGQDLLNGGDGQDSLNGSVGDDHLDGGSGNDSLNGNWGDDLLFGGDDQDALNGGVGTDYLYGDGGNDTLRGGAYNDILSGGTGKDRLYGGDGNDILVGGAGRDILTGGAGNDTFRLDHGNFDRIVDFNPVNDTINLKDHYFNSLITFGTLAADSFISGADITQAVDTNDFLIYNTSTGEVYYDADANGAGEAVQIALIGNHALLTAADFLIV
jgi:Ca2+-binding RTX toxin-like protein